MATEVKVPTLGELITEGTLAQWLKQARRRGRRRRGDRQPRNRQGQRRSAVAGRRRARRAAGQGRRHGRGRRGDCDASTRAGRRLRPRNRLKRRLKRQPTRQPIRPAPARIQDCAAPTQRPSLRAEEAAASASGPAPAPAPDDDHITTLSPAVRRAVLEHHVDPTRIKGTGRDGRLTKDDVLAAAAAQKGGPPAQAAAEAPQAKAATPQEAQPTAPSAQPSPGGGRKEERVKMSRLRQTVARAPQGSAEHRRDPHHFQRRRHDGGDRGAHPLQGFVREEARHPPRLHGLFR